MPSFYARPQDVNAVVDTVVCRVPSLLALSHPGKRWGEDEAKLEAGSDA